MPIEWDNFGPLCRVSRDGMWRIYKVERGMARWYELKRYIKRDRVWERIDKGSTFDEMKEAAESYEQ